MGATTFSASPLSSWLDKLCISAETRIHLSGRASSSMTAAVRGSSAALQPMKCTSLHRSESNTASLTQTTSSLSTARKSRALESQLAKSILTVKRTMRTRKQPAQFQVAALRSEVRAAAMATVSNRNFSKGSPQRSKSTSRWMRTSSSTVPRPHVANETKC